MHGACLAAPDTQVFAFVVQLVQQDTCALCTSYTVLRSQVVPGTTPSGTVVLFQNFSLEDVLVPDMPLLARVNAVACHSCIYFIFVLFVQIFDRMTLTFSLFLGLCPNSVWGHVVFAPWECDRCQWNGPLRKRPFGCRHTRRDAHGVGDGPGAGAGNQHCGISCRAFPRSPQWTSRPNPPRLRRSTAHPHLLYI